MSLEESFQTPPDSSVFSSIEEILDEIRAGKMVVVTDDEDRENEGDLLMAAEKCTPEAINFMARFGRGLICAPITEERAIALGLPHMTLQNREAQGTAFTVSVDATHGVTTGISASDRAKTVSILVNPEATEEDLVRPGHIFPLCAKPGGVLRRAGHTEAAVDLARMAGLQPAGVICEILKDDGEMARLPDLIPFCREHGIKMLSIRHLIEYRRRIEQLVEKVENIKMPTEYGTFELHLYQSVLDGQEHLALVKGEISPDEPTLVRVHSECLTGDVFGSCRCDCGPQLHRALHQIEKEGRGVLLYMRQEGRGIGLKAKIHAYKLQEQGYDTLEANLKLGFAGDLRDYGIGAQILADIGVGKIRLMTNNPRKIVGLEGHQLEIVERVPIKTIPNEHNARYLETKRLKMGHLF